MHYFGELQRIASEHADRPAIIDGTRSLTYGDLLERVEAAAGSLADEGIGPASTVALTLADEFENIIAAIALLRAGAMQLTLASHDSVEMRALLAERIRATHSLATHCAPAIGQLHTVNWPLRMLGSTRADVPAGGLYLRTSGTTGDSNLVPFSADDILVQALRNPEYRFGRHLRLASVEHNNSKRHRLYTLCMGGTVLLRPAGQLDLAAYCRSMEATHVDVSIMHAVDLANSGTDLSRVELRIAGSAAPLEVRKRIEERVTAKLYVRYATTETGTVALCPPGRHEADEPAGRPVPGVEVEIVDQSGAPLSKGEVGQIRLRGGGFATHYFENQEQTLSRFRDGWFWPGDVGLIRQDGVLVVKGRADDMIILNGINIFPAELERVLERHPAVSIAAAAGLPSLAHGHIPVAAVELAPGASVDERTLLQYARELLGLRAPRRIRIVAALPRNAQGKLLRRQLPALFEPPGSGL